VRAALPAWLVARVAVLFSLAAAHLLFDYLDPMAPSVARHVDQGLLGWDAERYWEIASKGYEALPVQELRFFPLFPLLARALEPLTPGAAGSALLLVANGAALAMGVVLYRLSVLETGDQGLGRRAAWLVAFTPPAFVLVWGYSEALGGLLTVLCFLCLRTRRWGGAAAAGILAALTRPVGVLLALPAAIEATRGLRSTGWRERAARMLAVAAPVAGSGAYLGWVAATRGDPFLPLSIQQEADFRGDMTNPLVVMWRAVDSLLAGTEPLRGNAIHVPWALLLVALVVLTFRYWPVSYGVFAAASVLVALSAERLGSLERYGFAAFPVILTLAVLAARRPVERAVIAVGGITMTAFATMALLGRYVP
jgi:hypothetical protein